MLNFAKLIHEAFGIDSPRIFIFVFALIGFILFGEIGWLVDKGYRVKVGEQQAQIAPPVQAPAVRRADDQTPTTQEPLTEPSKPALKPQPPARGSSVHDEKGTSPSYRIEQHTQGGPAAVTTGPNSPITINPDQGWRRISDSELTQAASFLSPFAGQAVKIVVANQDGDRLALAQRVAEVFRRAGWNFEGIETPMVWFNPQATEFPRGHKLHVKEVTPAAEASGHLLLSIFGQANVADGHRDEAFESQTIELDVWPAATR
jgi:hypothetical protein